MKSKLLAVLLALNVMCWAQTSTTPNPAPAPEKKSAPAEAKPACPCCEHMGADHAAMHNGMESCCMHKDAAGKDKDAMSCCAGMDDKMACGRAKDNKATAKDDKAPASCCGSGKCAAGKEMSCCAAKAGDADHDCCGGNACGKHDHAQHAAPGN
jgi:hypothetical protein